MCYWVGSMTLEDIHPTYRAECLALIARGEDPEEVLGVYGNTLASASYRFNRAWTDLGRVILRELFRWGK